MKGFRWWTKLRMRLAMWLIQDYVRSNDQALKVFQVSLNQLSNLVDDVDKALAVVRVQVDNFNTPDIDYEKLAQEVNVQEVADHIDYQGLAPEIDAESIAEYIDVVEVALGLDTTVIAEEVCESLAAMIRNAMR